MNDNKIIAGIYCNSLFFLVLVGSVLFADSAFACQVVGSPETTRFEYKEQILVKKNQRCTSSYNLKSSGGRLSFRSVDLSDIQSDGSVQVKLEKRGESDYVVSYQPTLSGEHWVSFYGEHVTTDGRHFRLKYIYELKVDIPYKDPGSLD